VLPSDSTRSARPGRRRGRVAVEGLETRQLMAYSAFGYSLPQLSVSGYAAPTAAWGGPLSIDVRVQNLGASSLVEPTHLQPGSPTNADSGPTTVEIYASATPGANNRLVPIDVVQVPNVLQNSLYENLSTIALPARPAGFPGAGGNIYLTFVVNNNQAVIQNSTAGNIYRDPTPVRISQPLPDLQVVGFDVPAQLQPGDVIAPTVRIANFGSANPASQGPVLVQLVASLNTSYGPGDAVVGQYEITSLPGISGVPTRGTLANIANVILAPDENDFTFGPIQLPSAPGFYHLGVKIDPFGAIHQTYAPFPALSFPVNVGPAGAFPFPTPATVVATTTGLPVFPALSYSTLTAVPVTTPTPPTAIFPSTPPTSIAPTTPILAAPQGSVVSAFAVSGYPIVVQPKGSKAHLVHLVPTAKPDHLAPRAPHKAAPRGR